MGMFDRVYIDCPKCATLTEVQSKAGKCDLGSYSLNDAPAKILLDIQNTQLYCPKGHEFYIRVQSIVHGVSVLGTPPEEE